MTPRFGEGSAVRSPGDSCIVRLHSIVERIDTTSLFPEKRPLEVELGCGDGSFLVAYGRSHPELNLLGVERLLGRLRKTDRKVLRGGLENVRLLRIEARYFVEFLLGPAAVRAIHIYFPDPWPKRRHWKYRLIDEGFVAAAARALQPGGRLYLRTDNHPYWSQARDALSSSPLLLPVDVSPELAAIRTDFELEFLRQGTPTLHLAFCRR